MRSNININKTIGYLETLRIHRQMDLGKEDDADDSHRVEKSQKIETQEYTKMN